ncbi:MAG: LirA/MavJ family T4SS effector, partial [Acidobacteriota bacterium]
MAQPVRRSPAAATRPNAFSGHVIQGFGMKVSELENVPPALHRDFLNVQRILGDRDITQRHLQTLSAQVAAHPRYADNPREALQDVLGGHEQRRGFDAEVPRYAGFLDADTFLGNIRAARSFDDIGAAPAHGPETHRIQWHVVASELERIRAEEAPNAQHQLQHAADSTALYRELGNQNYGRTDEHGRRWYAWDALMDRQGGNPAGQNTFVTIDEARPAVFAGGQRQRVPSGDEAIPRDAGLPIHFSNMLLQPDVHFPGAEPGSLEALRRGVDRGQRDAQAHAD